MSSRKFVVSLFSVAVIVVVAFTFMLPALADGETIRIQNYDVTYQGRTYENDQTTFTYLVSGTGVPPDLSHFDLEIPDCTPALQVVAYDPTDAVDFGVDPNTGVDGIKWDLPLKVDESRTYSITFAGNIAEGEVEAAVKGGDGFEIEMVPGASCDTAEAAIDVEKLVSVDGMTTTWDDADDAPGVQLPVGGVVYFRFDITNLTQETLTNVQLTDDMLDTSACNIPATLAAGATTQCILGPFTVESGQHTNIATVTAVLAGATVTDTDAANYLGTGEDGLRLIEPTGTLTETIGNPTYIWTTVEGATTYEFYLALARTPRKAIFYDGALAASEYCDDVCTLTPTERPDGGFYWLTNGNYVVYLKADNTDWAGPFSFTVDVPQPDQVTLEETTFAMTYTSRPTFNWSLEGDAVYSSWFQIYVAPSDQIGRRVVATWHSREEACGSWESTDCALESPVDLTNNTYSLYVRNWGPGGLSGPGATGWAGPEEFTIDAPVPTPVTEMAVAGTETGNPSFSWRYAPGASWYQIWIGSPGPDFETSYTMWYRADDLGCDTTCVLSDPEINLGTGTFAWYVRSWGPAGYSQGGVSGWAEGPSFTR